MRENDQALGVPAFGGEPELTGRSLHTRVIKQRTFLLDRQEGRCGPVAVSRSDPVGDGASGRSCRDSMNLCGVRGTVAR